MLLRSFVKCVTIVSQGDSYEQLMTTIFERIKKQIQNDRWFQQNFSNDGQRFVAWYLRNIHLRDRAETKDDVTDGANDKQIDAVVVNDVERKIYVIQGKFTDGETVDAQPVREILSAWQHLRDLENIQSIANQHLRRKLAELAKARDDDAYEVCFELVTTSSLTDAAKNDFAVFQKTLAELSENENWDSTATLVDREELTKRYDYALDHNSVINHTISLSDDRYFRANFSGTQVILAAVPLRECLNFPGIKDGSLFQKNVRQNLGNNDVTALAVKIFSQL